MSESAYIEDGYTEDGYMKKVAGLYQACAFKFRPPLPGTVRVVLDKWGLIGGELKSERVNKLLADYVVEWDLAHNGKVLPIKVETFEKLKQPFVDRLFNIVTGADVSDEAQKTKAEQQKADAKN